MYIITQVCPALDSISLILAVTPGASTPVSIPNETGPHGAHRRSPRNRIVRGAVTVAVGAAIWLLPLPAGVALKAWHLLAIFFATIIGLILQPVPMGAVVLFGMTATALTATLSINDALNGYMNPTVWLIVAAFLFARAFSKTGLGRRIAYSSSALSATAHSAWHTPLGWRIWCWPPAFPPAPREPAA